VKVSKPLLEWLPTILAVALVHGGNTEPKYYLKKKHTINQCGHYFGLYETVLFPITNKRALQISDPWDNSGQGDYNINQTEVINRFLTAIDIFQ